MSALPSGRSLSQYEGLKPGAVSSGSIESIRFYVADSRQDIVALHAEVEALRGLVADQCELIGDLEKEAAEADKLRDENEALREAADLWAAIPDYLADVLSEVMGSSNPVSVEACPLPSVKALAKFVRGE